MSALPVLTSSPPDPPNTHPKHVQQYQSGPDASVDPYQSPCQDDVDSDVMTTWNTALGCCPYCCCCCCSCCCISGDDDNKALGEGAESVLTTDRNSTRSRELHRRDEDSGRAIYSWFSLLVLSIHWACLGLCCHEFVLNSDWIWLSVVCHITSHIRCACARDRCMFAFVQN